MVDTNEKLFDLLNEWSNKVLEPTSNVGDTKQYVNQLYKILPLFINQSIIFSDTVLTKDSSWETLKPNTIHYFNALGGEGTPDSSMVKIQAGYLLYINSSVTDKGLQICVTEDLNVLFRFAPKGTWIMNATNLSVKQLTDKINYFAEQIDEKGLNALQLRTEALNGKISDVQTQVTNSYVGTNLLIGTETPVSIMGNNSGNQGANTYSLIGGMNAYALYQKYGSTFTLSYDWSVTDTASAYTGQMQQQFAGNPWGFNDITKISSSNTSGHKITTFTLANDSGNVAHSLQFHIDNVPNTSTITVSNMKLEKGNVATDYSLNPKDISTSESVQNAITNAIKGIKPTDLSNYPTKSDVATEISSAVSGVKSEFDITKIGEVSD